MYKVLIVDDEKRICSLINAIVDWDGLGLKVVGCAYDGIEAISMIHEKSPDIVITDIRMPEIDGIEIIRQAQEFSKVPQFIIISGYKEFDYAHKAIQFGVKHYLLKPIQAEEIADALKSIELGFEEKEVYEKSLEEADKKLGEAQEYIKSQLVCSVVKGVTPDYYDSNNASNVRLVAFHVVFHNVMENESYESVVSMLCTTLSGLLEGKQFDYGIYYENDIVWVLFQADYNGNWKKTIDDALDRLAEKMLVFGDINAGISNEHAAPVKEMRAEAIRAVRWHWVYDIERIIRCDKLPTRAESCLPKELKPTLMQAIETLDSSSVMSAMSSFFQDNNGRIDPDTLCDELSVLWSDLYEYMAGMYVACPTVNENIDVILMQCSGIKEAILKFGALIVQLMNSIQSQKEKSDDYYVRSAKKYIQDNLNTGLSLDSVSEFLHISPQYLSSLFKQKTGVNFKDFITDKRIEKAKQLIISSPEKSIGEIGEEVGYPDQQYFSKLFTKTVGIKPSKYKKLHL